MSNDIFKKERLEEQQLEKKLKDERSKIQMLEKKLESERLEVARLNKKELRKEKRNDKILDFFSTLVATLIGVFIAFLGAYSLAKKQTIEAANQAQIQKSEARVQEVDLVIQFLENAKDDVSIKIGAIEQVAVLVNLNNLSQKGSDSISILQVYSTPGEGIPYPIVLERVIDNDKVL